MKKLSLIVFAFLFSVTAMTGAMAQSVEQFVSETLENFGTTPPQDQIGRVIGQICPSGNIITNADLQARCNEIAGGGINANPGARDGLQAMAPEENAVVASSQVDAGSAQIDNIGDRLSALRSGRAGGERGECKDCWDGLPKSMAGTQHHGRRNFSNDRTPD